MLRYFSCSLLLIITTTTLITRGLSNGNGNGDESLQLNEHQHQQQQQQQQDSEKRVCGFYLAPSLIPGAVRGVIAGKDFQSGDLVELSVSLIMPSELINNWQLFNYVYSANPDAFSMALFGAGMLYNHMKPKNLDNYWHTIPNIDSETYRDIYAHPYTTYTDVEYVTNRDIRLGEELFASYGEGSDWFNSRGIDLSPFEYNSNDPPRYSLEFLESQGHCMTDIEVRNSSIPLAGRGIFAKRAFKKGEIVTLSPVLVLPKHELPLTTYHSVLVNYCVNIPKSDLVMLPIGLGGLINHGGKYANVEINWYDWSSSSSPSTPSTSSLPERLNWSAEKLESNPFAPLDFQYVATQDIANGEEILLNYGIPWEEAWMNYLNEMKNYWLEFGSPNIVVAPQFRSMIDLTSSIDIPSHLQAVPCVGRNGCPSKNGSSSTSSSSSSSSSSPSSISSISSSIESKQLEMRRKELQRGKEFIEKYFQRSPVEGKRALGVDRENEL